MTTQATVVRIHADVAQHEDAIRPHQPAIMVRDLSMALSALSLAERSELFEKFARDTYDQSVMARRADNAILGRELDTISRMASDIASRFRTLSIVTPSKKS